MWRPLGVKNHWENKKQQENQDVETNGGEKPLGKQKNNNNKMWIPMGIKKPLGNPKKNKCGDQWGCKAIGKSQKLK